jgi:hypothetical protein
MFGSTQSNYQQKKITTGLTGLAAAGGLTYGLVKKKGFWGCAAAAGICAAIAWLATSSVYSITKKD